MITALIVGGLIWVVVGSASFLFGAAHGLDGTKVKKNLSNLASRDYIAEQSWFRIVLEFVASFFWFPVAYPIFAAAVGFCVLILFI